MDRALLDTDIVSEILKARSPSVLSRAADYRAEHGRFTITTLSVLEIVKGLHKLGRDDRIDGFLLFSAGEQVLTLDIESAQLAGRIFADLERIGQPIGRIDPMIAAIACRHDLLLVTGNTSHYKRIQTLGFSLKLDNWRSQVT